MSKFEKIGPHGIKESLSEVTINDDRGEELGKGLSEGVVRRVRVEMAQGNRLRTVTLAEKSLYSDSLNDKKRTQLLSSMLDKHARLKKDRIPTIPSVRVEKGNNKSVYMTDLTEGGVYEIVSIPDWSKAGTREGKFYKNKESVVINNPEEVTQALNDLYIQSLDSGFELGIYPDSIFLKIDKASRNASVLLGDLNEVVFVENVSPKQRKELIEKNFDHLETFIEALRPHVKTTNPINDWLLKQTKEELMKEYTQISSGTAGVNELLDSVRKFFRI